MVVAGNHELYARSHTAEASIERCRKECEAATARGPGRVHFLHCSSVRIGGVDFNGVTLWGEVDPAAGELLHRRMSDYKEIKRYVENTRTGGKLKAAVRWQTIRDWHREQLAWLRSALFEGGDGAHPAVVVTHHAPMGELGAGKGPFRSAYASDLKPLIREGAATADLRFWVYGHTHDRESMDVRASGSGTAASCRVVTNARGYACDISVDGEWDPDGLVFEVSLAL